MNSLFISLTLLIFSAFSAGCRLDTKGDLTGADALESEGKDTIEAESPPECTIDEQCSDGEPCSGIETCSGEGACLPGDPLPDGAGCTSRSGAAGECRGAVCIPMTCGNGTLEEGEECDDDNSVPEDGCEDDCTYSCHGDGDCGSGDPCYSGSCTAGGTGMICTFVPTTDPCDDGLYCTSGDTCDNAGNCLGATNTCDDGLWCTGDDCTEGPSGPICSNPISFGSCLVSGSTCYVDEEREPGGCLVCRSDQSNTSLVYADDRTACTEGICCTGVCRVGGDCCAPEDCTDACVGTAQGCGDLGDPADCYDQGGCDWVTTGGACSGDNTCPSRDPLPDYCTDCTCGRFAHGSTHCSSTTPCDGLSFYDCYLCGCPWLGDSGNCAGTPDSCSSFTDPPACASQAGCYWSSATCTDYMCQ